MTTGELRYAVHISDLEPLPTASPLQPPDGQAPRWSPLSSTLVYGDAEAVLVDPPMTIAQAEQVAEWVSGFGVRLRGIYITHAHGDHWYGTTTLLDRFPDTPVYAAKGTIAAMRAAHPDGKPTALFASILPGKLADTPVLAQPVPADGLTVDGHALLAIEIGHADTDDSTVLHAPSIGLVVAGDVIYNNVHQFLGEAADGGLDAWLAAVDRVESLAPRFVVAGHRDRTRPDDPGIIAETRD
ncbi:MAG TPA: MBL fold metallo-hydrolase, partial [Pseudonocardiaceae bacterium]